MRGAPFTFDAQVFELTKRAVYRARPLHALQLYYGHIFGGSVVGSIYHAGREGDYGFIIQTAVSL